MPSPPIRSGPSAELALLDAGFELIESRSGHRIYRRNQFRVIIPFPADDQPLHPKVMVQIRKALKSR